MACWTVGAIEDTGVPNTLGFNNRYEYYEECSSLQYIPHIRTPTLFLNAKDDPFLGWVGMMRVCVCVCVCRKFRMDFRIAT